MRMLRSSLLLCLLLPSAGLAQRTVPMSLKTMVQQAGIIVHARVSETRTAKDPSTGFPATWVTLEVSEDLFGAPGSRFTFKQIGGEADGMAYRLAELPAFTEGEEVVLLLYAAHGRTGFQSPVGMGQGKFMVRQEPGGRKKVAEQITRSPQLAKASLMVAADGTVGLRQLKEEIRTLVRTEKGVSK